MINSEEENSPMNTLILNTIDHSNTPMTRLYNNYTIKNITIKTTHSSHTITTNHKNNNRTIKFSTKIVQYDDISEIRNIFIRQQTSITNINTIHDDI